MLAGHTPNKRTRRPAPNRGAFDYSAPKKPSAQAPDTDTQYFIYGPNAVQALLEQEPGRIHRVLFLKESGNKRLFALQKSISALHIQYQQVDARTLQKYSAQNQGVVALCHERALNDWAVQKANLQECVQTNTPAIVVIASQIEDPRNLGAAIRSCLGLGVHTLLLPAKGSCGLTPLTAKTSAGAMEVLPICKPGNIEAELDDLKQMGFTIFGLDAESTTMLHKVQMPKHFVLIVGGEHQGVPPYLEKKCSQVLRIPMQESAHSFNTSVALSLALYQAYCQHFA
jgi:23S rRNA (guanosine2251-2'-O)-methyltransferase